MGSTIGDVLSLALGILISPIPIIAAILMLLSPRARATSIGFMVGWILGIAFAVTLFTLISSLLPEPGADDSKPVAGTIKIILGILLLLLALRQWRGRPRGDDEPKLPGWMKAIDSMTAAKGVGLGFLLAAVNPKNLLLSIGAGLIIGASGLPAGQVTVVIIVFTVIAGASVLVPVIAYLVASARMAGPLDAMRTWMTRENAVIMSVLLLLLGVVLIGKGIGNF
ncbi:GAP family protein [Leifsonia sp. A12D58]|uniref:GAP family protein n=1 Tax=Leifsonia sp. A12D58 TaxID=3397674 RepID=UPI0039E01BE2